MGVAFAYEAKYMKSIKITDIAQKGLQLLSANVDEVKQGQWASLVIIEALEREHPEVYAQLRQWAIRNDCADDIPVLHQVGGER